MEARVAVAQALFARVVDVENFHLVIDAMDGPNSHEPDERDAFNIERLKMDHRGRLALARCLGWLNVWTPMHADGFYSLDLSRADDRKVVTILLKLAVVEPGENWVGETLNGAPFELPEAWMNELPTTGVVTTTYVVDEHQKVQTLRQKLSETFCIAASVTLATAGMATHKDHQHKDHRPDPSFAAVTSGEEEAASWDDSDPQSYEVSEALCRRPSG